MRGYLACQTSNTQLCGNSGATRRHTSLHVFFVSALLVDKLNRVLPWTSAWPLLEPLLSSIDTLHDDCCVHMWQFSTLCTHTLACTRKRVLVRPPDGNHGGTATHIITHAHTKLHVQRLRRRDDQIERENVSDRICADSRPHSPSWRGYQAQIQSSSWSSSSGLPEIRTSLPGPPSAATRSKLEVRWGSNREHSQNRVVIRLGSSGQSAAQTCSGCARSGLDNFMA